MTTRKGTNAMKHTVFAILGSVLLTTAGCASGTSQPTARGRDAGAPAVADAGSQLSLPSPENGMQIATSGRAIAAGADEEWCEVVELPGGPEERFLVARTELAMTRFSHHLVVSMAQGGSPALDAAALHDPVPCAGAHLYGTNLVTLAASAKPYVSRELPDGVGFELRGGQRLVFDYHALNTGAEPTHVEHRLNLHYVERIEKPARTFGFYNQYIQIPPHSDRSFTDECLLDADVLVWSLGRHTHRHGTEFRVWWVGGERDGELIWTSMDWEQDIEHRFEQPVVVAAGEGFRWECSFTNPTDATLAFGPQASDEMCILFGSFAALGDDADVEPQSCYRFTP
jgi:Copper type II ascorbate-dependent monooxygenase, C-terminal domain